MDEAEQLCDRLVVMDNGRIVDEGSPRALIERHCPREVLELRFGSSELQSEAAKRLAPLPFKVDELPDRVVVYTDDGDAASVEVSQLGVVPSSSLVRRTTLEDVFLQLTGRSLVET